MALLVITGGQLVALWIVLFTVRHLRPRKFRVRATLAKWASLDLEMESPQPMRPAKSTMQPRARTLTSDSCGVRAQATFTGGPPSRLRRSS
jgi:hypothetical protein